MSGVRTVSVVGSTGSIGTQAIEVLAGERERFRVVALAAGSSVGALAEQARALGPEVVAVADSRRVAELRDAAPRGTEVLCGDEGLDAGLELLPFFEQLLDCPGLPLGISSGDLGRVHRLA